MMFQMTQGVADGEPVVSSPKNDKFDNYLIALEKSGIDERIAEAQKLYDLWDTRCKATEAELRQSRELNDQIYVRRWIEHKGVKRIAYELHYSKRAVYYIVKKIAQNCTQAVL